MMSLATYLAAEGIPQGKFAERLGVDQATVSRLARRRMRPSLALAVLIERETAGAVLASSWIEEDTAA